MNELKPIIALWDNYYNVINLGGCDIDSHSKTICKLQNGDFNFKEIKEKYKLVQLIEIIAVTIYNKKNYVDKYNTNKIYNDEELNYCSRIINCFCKEIFEDEYEENVTNKMLELFLGFE